MTIDLYTLMGAAGGILLGIAAWIVFRAVRENREVLYEETDRIQKEKERIAGLKEKNQTTAAINPGRVFPDGAEDEGKDSEVTEEDSNAGGEEDKDEHT